MSACGTSIGFFSISTVQLFKISIKALFNLFHAPLHLGTCEVPAAVVHRFELAAINRHDGVGKQIELPA